MTAVLDASALLALLLGEPGADKVGKVLADAAMTTINLAEVVGHYARHGASLSDIHAVLDGLPVTYMPPDEALAYDIGMLQLVTAAAGLSLGDRACLALGRRLDAPVLTADRNWTGIAKAAGVAVELLR
jgi:ribonuclease VapC